MGEACDICGDVGVLEALYTCSKCKIAREHFYCRKPFTNEVPSVWLCFVCELPENSMPYLSAIVDQGDRGSAGCGELPRDSGGRGRFKWEKTVRSGKVKYMPTKEAIMLSSGVRESKFPSKSNLHPSSAPSKSVASMSPRTPIKPKVNPPKSSSQNAKENHSFRPAKLSHPGFFNTQINSVVKQQAVQPSTDPKGACLATSVSEKKAFVASRREHIHKRKTIDTLMPAIETERAGSKEGKKVNEESFASLVIHSPPVISSGRNAGISRESRIFDDKDGLVTVLPKAEECFRGPALYSSWKGSFEVLDNRIHEEFNNGFQAHPPSKVRRKVYEFSKKMPEVLKFKMLPRYNVWTEIFQDDYPDEDDIGLYFFSSNSQRSANYSVLLEFIETRDFMMRSYIDGVELLMFSSKHLSSNSQKWNDKYFLWGIFRRVKKYKAVSKLREELPPLYQPSDCSTDNDANRDDTAVDMEIDMVAGKYVGRIDKAIQSKESSIQGCGSPREENAALTSLHGSGQKITGVLRKMDFATPQPLLKVKKELFDIPPGFEGKTPVQ